MSLRTCLVTLAVLCGVSLAVAAEPKIIDVKTSSPRVLVVTVQTGPHTGGYANPIDKSPASWKINGVSPKAVNLYSTPYDESKKLAVTMRHRVFLTLPTALKAGETYKIDTPYGKTELTFDPKKTICDSIKVNQVGYNAKSTSRYANLGVYMGDGGSMKFDAPPKYEVIEEKTGKVVASGVAKYMGDDTKVTPEGAVTSGEHVYRLSLDDVPVGGPYVVAVDGFGRSYPFGVGDQYSREAAAVHTRGLYHQRCGIALEEPYTSFTRGKCHGKVAFTRKKLGSGWNRVPANAEMHPMKGGYHDAADFDIRPMHVVVPLLMLNYFEAFPDHFVDSQYNIPESGNGIPDFLDEALWGTLVWENLQVMDEKDPEYGGVMAGFETSRHPGTGDSAANDKLKYGTWQVDENVTAIACGLFAQASRLVKPYDKKRSEKLLKQAKLAWAYLEKHAKVNDAKTRFMYPALQLYLATGESKYHDIFKAAADKIVVQDKAGWPEQYLPGNTAAKCTTSNFISYLLTDKPTDKALKKGLTDRIFRFADRGGFMGPAPETFPYAQGVTKYLGWGAGTASGRYADVYCFAYRLAKDVKKKQDYFNAVSQYADYALGVNPLGMSYTTGLGTVQPVSTCHLDSRFTKYGQSDGVTKDHVGKPIGQVPGIVIYGPCSGRSGAGYQRAVTDKLYPKWNDLPGLRRWGDGWSLINGNEFTVWETQVWNTVMHGFLYNAGKDPKAAPYKLPEAKIIKPILE